MPWRCPACREVISHPSQEDLPKPRTRYRCYVCRLELIWSEHVGSLQPAPLTPGDAPQERETR